MYAISTCHSLAGKLINLIMAKSFEELKPEIDKALQYLETCKKFTSSQATEAITLIESTRKYSSRPCDDQRRLGLYLVSKGYAQLFVKMWNGLCRFLEREKWKEVGFFNLKYMMLTYVTFTDQCPLEAGAEMGNHGCISLLFGGLKKLEAYFTEEAEFAIIMHVIQNIMATLYNSIHQCRSNREIYRELGAVGILRKYIKSANDTVSLLSLMILPYIVNESESGILATRDGGVATFVNLLQMAVTSDNHNANVDMVFSAQELLDCLNHIAINDDNKREIKEQDGILAIIIQMLGDDFTEEEQTVAAEAIWNLAFEPSVRESGQLDDALQGKKTKVYK